MLYELHTSRRTLLLSKRGRGAVTKYENEFGWIKAVRGEPRTGRGHKRCDATNIYSAQIDPALWHVSRFPPACARNEQSESLTSVTEERCGTTRGNITQKRTGTKKGKMVMTSRRTICSSWERGNKEEEEEEVGWRRWNKDILCILWCSVFSGIGD